ncbi:tyrosine-type recombinase/integrase [Clostridioides difficile]|uniref:site-specific integrase n=1 Tax=Clostridioides difficile TaxID=1496 RepID=UPI0005DE27AA|nr:site-specific integrase [Clostridioides difficile]EGT4969101.1 site-specific integrase [Clostridioides difficile]KJF62234.1 integrase [Clostridioides difficile]MCK3748991.1 site-specific integrase [Clostridioides difficile]MCP8398348.1 site-specific integrase [Clostridioides difficile]MCP8416145.1 site-specific integrase [Clostridioides difficile]
MKGGVRKRGKKWYYYFDAGIVDGKRKKVEKVGGETKKEAEKALRDAINEYENAGIVFDETNMNLSNYLDFWYKEYVLLNCKYNTQVNYRNLIKNHIEPELGKYKLKSINPAIIQEFLNNKTKTYTQNGEERRYTRGNLKAIYGVLNSALKSAVYPYKLIKENPAQYTNIPKNIIDTKKDSENKTITLDEFNKILEIYPKNTNIYIPLLIGFHTGMRKGEILGLCWDNVDLDNNIIKVRKNLIKRKVSEFELTSPKTKTSIRDIRIGDTLSKILKEEKLNQKKQKIKLGKWYTETEHDWVCRKKDGSFVNHNNIDACVRTINKKLNLDFNFHCLRHTHATLLLENGANIKYIQQRLGHSQLSTTMDTYSHVTSKMESETIDILENLVR